MSEHSKKTREARDKTSRAEKYKHIICTSTISRRVSLIILVILVGVVVAMLTYRGTFLFWKYPVSDLGVIYVGQQEFNFTSVFFFDFAMFVSCFLMIQIAFNFTSAIPFQHKLVKQILSFSCSLGFLLIIFPYTLFWTIHIIGAGLVVGSLWALAIVFSIEVKPFISTIAFIFYQIILQVSILTYAIMYTMGIPMNDAVQKFGILSLMIVLWFTTRYKTADEVSISYKHELKSE